MIKNLLKNGWDACASFASSKTECISLNQSLADVLLASKPLSILLLCVNRAASCLSSSHMRWYQGEHHLYKTIYTAADEELAIG